MTDHLRNEWIAEALTDADDIAEYERIRNEDLGYDPQWITKEAELAKLAADMAQVQSQYDPKDFGWWDTERTRDR